MHDRFLGQLNTHIQFVTSGIKPTGELTIRKEWKNKVIRILTNAKLHFKLNPVNNIFLTVIFFKDPRLKIILKEIDSLPASPLRDWCRGLLFGYNPSEILTFIVNEHFSEFTNNSKVSAMSKYC